MNYMKVFCFHINMFKRVRRMGQGRELWEQSKAGGVDDNERHMRHLPVSSPTEEHRKDKRRSDESGRQERTRPGLLFVFCVRQSFVRACRFTFVFGYFDIKFFKCLAGSRLLPISTNCVKHAYTISALYQINNLHISI